MVCVALHACVVSLLLFDCFACFFVIALSFVCAVLHDGLRLVCVLSVMLLVSMVRHYFILFGCR